MCSPDIDPDRCTAGTDPPGDLSPPTAEGQKKKAVSSLVVISIDNDGLSIIMLQTEAVPAAPGLIYWQE